MAAAAAVPTSCSQGKCSCMRNRKELDAAKEKRLRAYMTDKQTLKLPPKDDLPDVFPDNGVDVVYCDATLGWCCIGRMCRHPIELHPKGSPRRHSRSSSSGLSTVSGGSRGTKEPDGPDTDVYPFSLVPGRSPLMLVLLPPPSTRRPLHIFKARRDCVVAFCNGANPPLPPEVLALLLYLLRTQTVAFEECLLKWTVSRSSKPDATLAAECAA